MNALALANSYCERRGVASDALDPDPHALRATIRGLFAAAAGGSDPDPADVRSEARVLP